MRGVKLRYSRRYPCTWAEGSCTPGTLDPRPARRSLAAVSPWRHSPHCRCNLAGCAPPPNPKKTFNGTYYEKKKINQQFNSFYSISWLSNAHSPRGLRVRTVITESKGKQSRNVVGCAHCLPSQVRDFNQRVDVNRDAFVTWLPTCSSLWRTCPPQRSRLGEGGSAPGPSFSEQKTPFIQLVMIFDILF